LSTLQYLFGMAIEIGYLLLLAAGIMVCKKYSYKAGTYFFIFMLAEAIMNRLFGMIAKNIDMMQWLAEVFGVMIGELIAFIRMGLNCIVFAAFLILVLDLYRKLKNQQKPFQL